jgi:hypothetical protein
MILEKSGDRVDEFFHNVVHVLAHEEIAQERLNSIGVIEAKELVQDSYLILRHGQAGGASIDEYRMERLPEGNEPLSRKRKLRLSLTRTLYQDRIMSRFRRLRRHTPATQSKRSFYKAKHRIEQKKAEPVGFVFIPSCGAQPPVRRTGPKTLDASGSVKCER